MNKKALYSLLDRYVKGECTEDEKRLVEQWYSMLDDEELEEPTPSELDETSARMRTHVETQLALLESSSRRRFMTPARWFAVAAAISGLVLLSNFIITRPAESADFLSDAASVVEVTNANTAPMTITLDDSSTIVLRPKASI